MSKGKCFVQEVEIFVTALVKAHEEELDYESKQALGETENIKYKGITLHIYFIPQFYFQDLLKDLPNLYSKRLLQNLVKQMKRKKHLDSTDMRQDT